MVFGRDIRYRSKENILRATFIVANHGTFDSNGHLDQLGEGHMKKVAGVVQQVVVAAAAEGVELEVRILCSRAQIADESRGALTQALRIPMFRTSFHECLHVDTRRTYDRQAVRDLVYDSIEEDTCVVVLTHSGVVPDIARQVARRFGLADGQIAQIVERGYGEGWQVSPEGVVAIQQPD